MRGHIIGRAAACCGVINAAPKSIAATVVVILFILVLMTSSSWVPVGELLEDLFHRLKDEPRGPAFCFTNPSTLTPAHVGLCVERIELGSSRPRSVIQINAP